jgi:hypothetical protein
MRTAVVTHVAVVAHDEILSWWNNDRAEVIKFRNFRPTVDVLDVGFGQSDSI